jgi:hypothetical protein
MVKCSFCGKKEGTEKIADPNLSMDNVIDWSDNENWWMVCELCKQYIHDKTLEDMKTFLEQKRR